MAAMIKIKMPGPQPSLDAVQALPGLEDLPLDARFGIVCIDPRQSLYVVRAPAVDNLETRTRLSPEIQGAYGDVRISTT